MEITRRNFVKFGCALAACAALPNFARASLTAPARSLHLYNTHTSETLKTVYWEQGEYIPEALAEINHILRDHRNNEIKAIDKDLLDLLVSLHNRLDSSKPFEIISGYRSPASNAMLHEHSHGVASKSQHLLGKAIDIRLTDRPLTKLRDVAMTMQQGGVGYYPASNFVHVDTGKVRWW